MGWKKYKVVILVGKQGPWYYKTIDAYLTILLTYWLNSK
jgi:hypothetical protein